MITIASVPCWVTVFHQVLLWPCGQVACLESKSMVKLARSSPAPALACREVSASNGLTSVIPYRARLSTTSAADG